MAHYHQEGQLVEIVGEGLGVHFKFSKKRNTKKIDKVVLSDVDIDLNAKK
jgi:hypothetical protein